MKKEKKWKMGRMKKCMAGLMAMVLVMAGVPMYAGIEVRAAISGDYEYEVNDDGNSVTITKYNGDGGNVVIPEEIEGKKVTSIDSLVFWGCSSLIYLKMPDSVIDIGYGAFYECSSLISVELSK